MMEIRIIHPQGDKTKLNVASVVDYERDDYCIASQHKWENTEEEKDQAWDYCYYLARTHNLTIVDDRPSSRKTQSFLD